MSRPSRKLRLPQYLAHLLLPPELPPRLLPGLPPGLPPRLSRGSLRPSLRLALRAAVADVWCLEAAEAGAATAPNDTATVAIVATTLSAANQPLPRVPLVIGSPPEHFGETPRCVSF
jgi:hypothetical protein